MKNRDCRQLGYIWFRMDEHLTLNLSKPARRLFDLKNKLYSKYGSNEVFMSEARKYCNYLWDSKYPNWNGQGYYDILDKYFYDEHIEETEENVYMVLSKEIEINNIIIDCDLVVG